MGRTIEVTVTSVLQTTAGKMIFCRWPESGTGEESSRRDSRGSDRRESRNGRERGERREERPASVESGSGAGGSSANTD
jgi:hypothetical protein